MNLEWGDRQIEGRVIRSSVTYAEAEELARLARDGATIEVGSAYGFSSVYIARAARILICVDPHDALKSAEELKANLKHAGVAHKVVHANLPAETALPIFRSGSFDFAFVDGDHTELAVLHDVEQCLRLLKPGGKLAIHDYDEIHCPDVKPVVDELGLVPDYIVDTLFVTTKGKY